MKFLPSHPKTPGNSSEPSKHPNRFGSPSGLSAPAHPAPASCFLKGLERCAQPKHIASSSIAVLTSYFRNALEIICIICQGGRPYAKTVRTLFLWSCVAQPSGPALYSVASVWFTELLWVMDSFFKSPSCFRVLDNLTKKMKRCEICFTYYTETTAHSAPIALCSTVSGSSQD